jgi:hypothetical protein
LSAQTDEWANDDDPFKLSDVVDHLRRLRAALPCARTAARAEAPPPFQRRSRRRRRT